MATAFPTNDDDQHSSTSESESSSDDSDDSVASSQHEPEPAQTPSKPKGQRQPCKYYNSGHCKDGSRCNYWHVCKYAVNGNCKYGAKCRLAHPGGSVRPRSGDSSDGGRAIILNDGRYYQWQLNDGNGWKDIDNDHVIEAQYCLPHSKSLKIYSTPYGAVSINFYKMRVDGKRDLKVRRLDDGNTMWNWYCTLRRKWRKYGERDSKGKSSSVTSAEIERKFQMNPTGTHVFKMGGSNYEIRFKEMRQVGQRKKRKVTRRPVFRQWKAAAGYQVTSALQKVNLGGRRQ